MKLNLVVCLLLPILLACNKGEPGKGCSYKPLTIANFKNTTNTLIPINTQNSWVYTDTNIATGTPVVNPDMLLNIEHVYDVEQYKSVEFNQFLSQLTIVGDSLFTTEWTPENSKPGCYALHKYLFDVTDTTVVREGVDKTVLYKSNDPCVTPAGTFSGNIIYQTGTAMRMIVHPGVGIVQVEMGRRKLTLKQYSVH